ncbi:MAG: M60 family metallopeptidase, partial [Armatimonadota bacterium]
MHDSKSGGVRRLLVALAVCLAGRSAGATDADVKFLLDGVNEIAAPGVPGAICVFGDDAFAVVTGQAGRGAREPVVAAARMGKGRVVIFGHNGYFGRASLEVADTGRLVLNAIRWASSDRPPRVAVRGESGLLAFLKDAGISADAQDDPEWTDGLQQFTVLCVQPTSIGTSEAAAAVAKFIRDGGGLIAGETGWGWLQLHPGKTLTEDHVGNEILAPAGLVWCDGTLKRTAEPGFAAGEPPSDLAHAAHALDALEAKVAGRRTLSKDETAQASWIVAHAARSLARDDRLLLPRLQKLRDEHAAEAVPTLEKPLTADQPLARLALTLELEDLRRLPAREVTAHPAAAHFPGAVPDDAPRVTRTIRVDTTVPAWHSTGLYAAPGELIAVTVPDAAVGKGLRVRIGSTTCRNWHHAKWLRAPEITREYAIQEARTEAANAFGGLVYIVVPDGCKLGTIGVQVAGAVEAPFFRLGHTSLDEWRAAVSKRPAPWAEFASDKAVLTVPAKDARAVEDPESLMRLWDRILDTCAELAAWPSPDRKRPERYVADVQLCAGYMHAGYPIMIPVSAAPRLLDVKHLTTEGNWGLYHETGHNHQSGDWTFGGTGEVTVNLFTLYVLDKVCGIAPTEGRMAESKTASSVARYIHSGARFDEWKRKPFLALAMYVQMQKAFGWEAFRDVFAEYRDLPTDERPKNDDEKRDQWLVRFSRRVGRNLGPFFRAWGVPTSESKVDELHRGY